MKIIIVILAGVAFSLLANAQTNIVNTPPSPVNPLTIQLPDPLVTATGESYQAPKLLQVTANEIIISYVDQDGVLQAQNVKIADLATNLQRQLNYNPVKAAVAESNEVADAKLFKTSPFMTVQQQRQYEADGIAAREKMASDEAAAEAAAAEKAKEAADKERLIEAQEKIANNPPVINQTVIVQQQQQQ
jgi:hypothetical protein